MRTQKYRLLIVILIGLALAACSTSDELALEEPIITASTPEILEEPTPLPTDAPTATLTAQPTNTPEPIEEPTATVESTATLPSSGELHTIQELGDFQNVFNQKSDSPRLLLFMAKGCPSCLIAGEWIETQLLAQNPDVDIQIFVIWLITADGGGRWQEDLLDDPRVLHFYDPKRSIISPFTKLPIDGPERSSLARTYGQLSWGENAVWDAYYYFEGETLWEEEAPPLPSQAGQPLMTERFAIQNLVVQAATESNSTLDTSAPIEFEIVADQSAVSYGVGETFAGKAYNYAIGVTNVISGNVTIDFNNPAASTVGPITVNIREFQSDNILRDERIQTAHLESATFPLATFTPNKLSGLPDSYALGDTLQFEIIGDLTVRGTTVPTTFQVEASVSGDTLTGTASAQVLMTDFGFEPPVIANLIATENEVDIVFEFVARPAID